MLNGAVLLAAHKVLRPGGSFHLTSDDERYCARVAAALAADAARWQPAYAAPPHYRALAQGGKAARSAFDELWAARGFTRRFACRFMARRAREPEAAVAASGAAGAADAPGAAPGAQAGAAGAEEDATAAAVKRKRKKETSRQRKKRRARTKVE